MNKQQKTRLDDFMEKHPKAMVPNGEVPDVCAAYLGYCSKNCDTRTTCTECWNKPMKE